jgi:hypothetical protein
MLLVRLPYTPASQQAPLRPVTLQRLMVPLDGSTLAEAVLPLATDLTTATGATLTLVRVEPWITIGCAPYGAVTEFTRMEERAAAEAARYLGDGQEQTLPFSAYRAPVGIIARHDLLRMIAGEDGSDQSD